MPTMRFLEEHPVGKADNGDPTGFEDAVNLRKYGIGVLQILN
jgi:hypothetical protein